MKQLHELQIQTLKKLIFAENLSFSDLKPHEEIENNQFVWHLKQLINLGLVSKNKNSYLLTEDGRKYCNRLDTDTNKVEMQAKISALQVGMRNTNGYNEFLIYTRKKHPFFGCQGFPSGKVKWGEKTNEAAIREFKEETGLTVTPELVGIWHYLVLGDNDNTKEDKYFYIYRFLNPVGELISTNEGTFKWIREDAIDKYITKPFTNLQEIIDLIDLAKNPPK